MELKEGEIYKCLHNSINSKDYSIFQASKYLNNCKRITPSYTKSYFTSSDFSYGLSDISVANNKEKAHLLACIKANKYVPCPIEENVESLNFEIW